MCVALCSSHRPNMCVKMTLSHQKYSSGLLRSTELFGVHTFIHMHAYFSALKGCENVLTFTCVKLSSCATELQALPSELTGVCWCVIVWCEHTCVHYVVFPCVDCRSVLQDAWNIRVTMWITCAK